MNRIGGSVKAGNPKRLERCQTIWWMLFPSKLSPLHADAPGLAHLPVMQTVRMCAHDFAESLRLCAKLRMLKKSPDIGGHFDVLHIEPDQTIAAMTKLALEKVLILSE